MDTALNILLLDLSGTQRLKQAQQTLFFTLQQTQASHVLSTPQAMVFWAAPPH